MSKLRISVNGPLNDEVTVSGIENATPPLMCAGLLTSGILRLKNIPMLVDVKTTQKLLQGMGARALTDNISEFEINGGTVNNICAPCELVKAIHASILVSGPTLARSGEAQVSLPDDCAIGLRPVDQHPRGLETMGAEITIERGYVKAKGRLKGTYTTIGIVTVGGTGSLLMMATLAEGTTTLESYTIEPEVVGLTECLAKMGTEISGIGAATITIEGVREPHSRECGVVPDCIEAGIFFYVVTMTDGKVVLCNIAPKTMEAVLNELTGTGAIIEADDNWISIDMQQHPRAMDIRTVVHPGFPTDMRAQLMAMNAIVGGSSRVVETIFENRFMHVPELNHMGVDITTESSTAHIKGVEKLSSAVAIATDLRTSASLIMAGLAVEGETVVERIYHLDRGYEYIGKKLGGIGAKIERVCG